MALGLQPMQTLYLMQNIRY